MLFLEAVNGKLRLTRVMLRSTDWKENQTNANKDEIKTTCSPINYFRHFLTWTTVELDNSLLLFENESTGKFFYLWLKLAHLIDFVFSLQKKLSLLICVFVLTIKLAESNPVGFSTGPIGYSTGPIGYSTGPIGNSFSFGRSFGGGIGSIGGYGVGPNGVPVGGFSIIPFLG